MPRRPADDDSDEFDLPEGMYHDDDEPPTVPCPYCRADLAEDATYCPRCENYLSKEDAPREPRSAFWVVMMTLALLCAAFWLV